MKYPKILAVFLASAALFTLPALATAMPVGNPAVPEPAKAVDLERYLGRWYELARYENRFEKDCEGVTATYSRREGGGISVVNTCQKNQVGGPAKTANGRAKVVEGSQNAKLKVTFFWPFFGNYWVLDRDDEYSWAIVGEPSGKYLWILTREAIPAPEQVEMLRDRAAALGYDINMLRMTKHAPN